MSYEREFYKQPALPKQPMIAYGELKCVYTGKVFPNATTDAYNRYTKDFNKTNWRATQEFLLDQRFRFIHFQMQENLKEMQH